MATWDLPWQKWSRKPSIELVWIRRCFSPSKSKEGHTSGPTKLYTVVKEDGATPKRRLHKLIHRSCAIYFPGGVDLSIRGAMHSTQCPKSALLSNSGRITMSCPKSATCNVTRDGLKLPGKDLKLDATRKGIRKFTNLLSTIQKNATSSSRSSWRPK